MSRGGYRQGSGRKSVNPDDKRVHTTISISRETKERLDVWRAKGLRVGAMIDDMVLSRCVDMTIDDSNSMSL